MFIYQIYHFALPARKVIILIINNNNYKAHTQSHTTHNMLPSLDTHYHSVQRSFCKPATNTQFGGFSKGLWLGSFLYLRAHLCVCVCGPGSANADL